MVAPRLFMLLLLIAPLAVGQGQPVEDGEQVEILRVSNPYALTLDEPFDLQVTLRNHLDHAITVGLFATLHEADSGCRGGDASYSEVTQRRTPDGKVNYIHETVRLAAGQTLTYPTGGEEWQGVILEENGLPESGPYELCYWIESPTKSETDEEGNLKPVYPWFYDRHGVPVQVDLESVARIRVDAPEVRGGIATDTLFSVRTTLHNPFPESVLVRLSGSLHAADTAGCTGPALATRVLDTLEVRVPGASGGDGEKTVSILADGSLWEGLLPGGKVPASGQYILCLKADPVESQRAGDTQGTSVYVRKDNNAPTGILHVGLVRWGPREEIPFHLEALDADGDPVRIVWDFTGSRAVAGPDTNFTFPYLGTFQLTIRLDDGFEETSMTCLIPVPGDQTTENNAIHGCLVAPPEKDRFSIPGPGPGPLAVGLVALAWAMRRRLG